MSEHADNRANIDRKDHMKRKRASAIKTWRERCEEHPAHQEGSVSYEMIQMRMQEEIEDLRAEVGKLRRALRPYAHYYYDSDPIGRGIAARVYYSE